MRSSSWRMKLIVEEAAAKSQVLSGCGVGYSLISVCPLFGLSLHEIMQKRNSKGCI
jgi:hypothetical protein